MTSPATLGPTRRDRARWQAIAFVGTVIALLFCSTAATQITASHFGFAPELGPRWIGPLYPPFDWVGGSLRLYQYAPGFFGYLYVALAAAASLTLLSGVITVAIKTRSARPYADAHGSAKFLRTVDELREAGMLPAEKAAKNAGAGWTGPYLAGCRDKNDRIHYIRIRNRDCCERSP